MEVQKCETRHHQTRHHNPHIFCQAPTNQCENANNSIYMRNAHAVTLPRHSHRRGACCSISWKPSAAEYPRSDTYVYTTYWMRRYVEFCPYYKNVSEKKQTHTHTQYSRSHICKTNTLTQTVRPDIQRSCSGACLPRVCNCFGRHWTTTIEICVLHSSWWSNRSQTQSVYYIHMRCKSRLCIFNWNKLIRYHKELQIRATQLSIGNNNQQKEDNINSNGGE